MRHLLVLLFSFALAVTVFAGPPPDEFKSMNGTWIPIKAELGGEAMKSEFLTNTVMKLDNGKYEVTIAGSPDKGAYTIDAGAKPKAIDITGKEGPNAGRQIPGIYDLHGKTLRICYNLGGSDRPTEFKSPAGTKILLVTYERKKR